MNDSTGGRPWSEFFAGPGKGPRDLDVAAPPRGSYPISRGARERKLRISDRYDRRAEVSSYERLTETGTVRITFRVLDDDPFEFEPGYFIGIKATVGEWGTRRSPYCLVSLPGGDRSFQLLVRLVPDGPLSLYLASLVPGDQITFRGPSGRSMVPEDDSLDLVLLATGVGVGPLLALSRYLLGRGFDRSIRLYWGLRLADDICLVEELDAIAAAHPNFRYEITLSQPPAGWPGLRGRLTESVPPLLETLGGKAFCLVGNGAMIDEMSTCLSDLGVNELLIHQEVYFNVKYRAERADLDRIRERFVACDLFSPYVHEKHGGYLPSSFRRSAGS